MTCPTGKIQYATPQAAARAIKEIKRRNGARVQGFRAGSLMHFQCRFCRQWHTGHGMKRASA